MPKRCKRCGERVRKPYHTLCPDCFYEDRLEKPPRRRDEELDRKPLSKDLRRALEWWEETTDE